MRDSLLARVTLFNARRGGEPSRLRIEDWEDAERGKWIDSQRMGNLTVEQKALYEEFKVIYESDKRDLVPVLIPKDCVPAFKMLCDVNVRFSAGVNSNNKFVFPSTRNSLDHTSGWHAVQYVASEANVRNNVCATAMRHCASTLYASLDISSEKREAFYRHMGHSSDINKNVYQCPITPQEITRVGICFADIDGLTVSSKCASSHTVNLRC